MRRFQPFVWGVVALVLSGWGCMYRPSPLSEPDESSPESPYQVIDKELEVIASWYGHPYHGRRTANGEIYDMHLLTAAHRVWPFHTLVWVTHLGNGRKTLVRINDRGPFVEGREIDLSFEAARRLEMVEEGTSRVRLEVVRAGVTPVEPAPQEPGVEVAIAGAQYRIQLGAFGSQLNAQRFMDRLGTDVPWLELRMVSDGTLFRVQSQTCCDEVEGGRIRQRLSEQGLESILRLCE